MSSDLQIFIDILAAKTRLTWHNDEKVKLAATLRGSRPGVQSASLIMTSLMTSYLGNYNR